MPTSNYYSKPKFPFGSNGALIPLVILFFTNSDCETKLVNSECTIQNKSENNKRTRTQRYIVVRPIWSTSTLRTSLEDFISSKCEEQLQKFTIQQSVIKRQTQNIPSTKNERPAVLNPRKTTLTVYHCL